MGHKDLESINPRLYCLTADDYRRYGTKMDNLPPESQKFVEDEVERIIDKLSHRYQCTLLKQLYARLKLQIGDLNREIAKAERAEIAEKANGH